MMAPVRSSDAVVIAFHQRLENIGRYRFLIVHGHQDGGARQRESSQFHEIARPAKRQSAERKNIVPDSIERQYHNGQPQEKFR
jgi:hypothetical protein